MIDRVLDSGYAVGRIEYRLADAVVAFVRERALTLEWLIETHIHQDTFGKVFNEGTEFRRDGSQFDRLFADGGTYRVGALAVRVMHTLACMTHVFGGAVFVGDTLFSRTAARPAPTSPAATRASCMRRPSVFSRCRWKCGCSSAMTTA